MLRTEFDKPVFKFSDKQQRLNIAFYICHSADAMPWQVQTNDNMKYVKQQYNNIKIKPIPRY